MQMLSSVSWFHSSKKGGSASGVKATFSKTLTKLGSALKMRTPNQE